MFLLSLDFQLVVKITFFAIVSFIHYWSVFILCEIVPISSRFRPRTSWGVLFPDVSQLSPECEGGERQWSSGEGEGEEGEESQPQSRERQRGGPEVRQIRPERREEN